LVFTVLGSHVGLEAAPASDANGGGPPVEPLSGGGAEALVRGAFAVEGGADGVAVADGVAAAGGDALRAGDSDATELC
jgi:hypothetical protein